MIYVIVQEGNGVKIDLQQNVAELSYIGMFTNGDVFDSHLQKEFKVNNVIPGFSQTIKEMSIGERRIVKIPPDLAYGEKGDGNVIPPNSPLLFEIEIISFR